MTGGLFITFEGGEGVGKTTQLRHLKDSLAKQGQDVVLTREPGGTPVAEEIRNLLSHEADGQTWTPEAELMLLFAARAMHIRDVLKPAIEANKVILCDRYVDSTRVYQGYLQDVDMNFIQELENRIVGAVMPDLTFILDLPAEEAMARVHSRGAMDHYDRGDLAFYSGLRDGFLKIAEQNPNRCVIVDASQNEEAMAAEIEAAVKEKLG